MNLPRIIDLKLILLDMTIIFRDFYSVFFLQDSTPGVLTRDSMREFTGGDVESFLKKDVFYGIRITSSIFKCLIR